ncbi:MAG: cation:proton antiporter [Bacteroidales bacterium]|nr:cation:proton antiporter [Bacteroidales bacterium]
MSHLPSLITDLAVILILGSVFSLLCKYLKQPVVLGYIVAGFIAGPHFDFFQTVDPDNISVWADIGVIFLLFGMGLEFSFKKLLSVGKTGGKAMLFEALMLSVTGFVVGKLIGWDTADSLLLGAMLIMSSTAIIVKTFNDLGMTKQKFAGIVFGILVFEDLFAIIIMVLISTFAASKQFEGTQLAMVIIKLLFFMILWVVAGIFLIPTLLKKVRNHLNDETLLLVSIGLCLMMVVLATQSGFSSALGAFVMGSILSETVERERIEHIIAPVKDLFSAIFFVSVGMMVNPEVLVDNFGVILIIAATSILGKMTFSTLGVRLSGQNLKTSMQCGFSLAQMGEFSFIVAAMGMNMHLTGEKVYPIVIAVSVLTTFTTPYCMRLAVPAYDIIEKLLPQRFSRVLISKRSSARAVKEEASVWKQYLTSSFTRLVIYLIICLAILFISVNVLLPFAQTGQHHIVKKTLAALATLAVLAPAVRGMIHNTGKQASLSLILWTEESDKYGSVNSNRFILSFLITLRYIIASVIVFMVIKKYFDLPAYVVVIAVLVFFALTFNSKRLQRYNWKVESRFVKNFNLRQIMQEHKDAQTKLNELNNLHWIDSNMYFAEYAVGEDSKLNGKSLKNLNFRNEYNVIIISVERKGTDFDFPDGDFSLQGGDILWMLGTLGSLRRLDMDDESVSLDYSKIMTLNDFNISQKNKENSVIHCVTFQIEKDSEWVGNSLMDSSLMKDRCMVIAIERDDMPIINPSSHLKFRENDIVWVIGDKNVIYKLLDKNYFTDNEH